MPDPVTSPADGRPGFSVTVATWNRADLLRQTLEALLAMDGPADVTFEVLVCDNNSSDNTKQVVESFAGRFEERFGPRFVGPLHALFEPTQGKSHALNRLVAHARGEWLLFIDDDVKVCEDWLAAYARGAERYPDAACLGGSISPWLDHEPGRRPAFLLEHYPAVFGVQPVKEDRLMVEGDTAWGANMAVRRDALGEAPFDPRRGMIGGQRIAGEDVAVIHELIQQGRPCWLLHDAEVSHYVPRDALTLRRFKRWYAAIGAALACRRGGPAPGRFGVAWWAWREMARRLLRAAVCWRPWLSKRYLDALKESAHYWGYLRSGPTSPPSDSPTSRG